MVHFLKTPAIIETLAHVLKVVMFVDNPSSGVYYSEKMNPTKCFIWLLWLLVANAELTLESVHQKVNDLEAEMTALKVIDF